MFQVDRAVLSRRMNVENSPDVIPDAAILDLLYSENDDDIVKLLRWIQTFEKFPQFPLSNKTRQ